MKQSNTIVLIHGLFVNDTSWSEWRAYFEALGYTVHTPANPFHGGVPADLRRNPNRELRTTTLEALIMNLARLIDNLPEKPIIIGHSLAGFVVQKLVEMDKAVAGISINGAPPKNVIPGLKTIFAVFPVVNFLKGNTPFLGSRAWYHQNFFNTVSRAESDKLFDTTAVPESRKVARETLYKPIAHIDHKKAHVPLLFIGGQVDNIFPGDFTKRNAGAYKENSGITDLKIFPGRSHFICGQEGWEEVAGYIEQWLKGLAEKKYQQNVTSSAAV